MQVDRPDCPVTRPEWAVVNMGAKADKGGGNESGRAAGKGRKKDLALFAPSRWLNAGFLMSAKWWTAHEGYEMRQLKPN